jgi:hypothetical protein
MTVGMTLPAPRIIRTTVGVQLAWLFAFVSPMPRVILGASVYLKTMPDDQRDLRPLRVPGGGRGRLR